MKAIFTTAIMSVLVVMATVFSAILQAGSVEDGIASRIQAVGSVCVEGDKCAEALTVAAAGPKSAEDVYNTGCLACHALRRDYAIWASFSLISVLHGF